MYNYRWATHEDNKIITEFWYRMALETSTNDGIPIPSKERLKEIEELFEQEFNNCKLQFRLAIINNKIIACAGGLLREEYANPLSNKFTTFGWIINVYTDEEHRKNGIATILVKDVCTWLRDNGAERARLWSSSIGKGVYERIGFRKMMDLEKEL